MATDMTSDGYPLGDGWRLYGGEFRPPNGEIIPACSVSRDGRKEQGPYAVRRWRLPAPQWTAVLKAPLPEWN